MSVSREFVDWVLELLAPLGPVTARRMFGGFGFFLDGLMFAIALDEAIWFKTDSINRQHFVALGEPPFTYLRNGRLTQLYFYRAPDDAFDAPHALLPWARSAFEAALRSKRTSAPPKRRKAHKGN